MLVIIQYEFNIVQTGQNNMWYSLRSSLEITLAVKRDAQQLYFQKIQSIIPLVGF